MKFLRYDSPFMSFLRRATDYMCVGILWCIFSIPVITGGAALTAALLTAEIAIRKEEGHILKTYWTWFRKEFKEATLLWLIRLPILCLVAINTWLLSGSTLLPLWVKVLIYIVIAFVFCWTQLWFGYLSKFEDKIKTVLSNTLLIALSRVGTCLLVSIVAVAAVVVAVFLFFLMPPLLVLIPGTYLSIYGGMTGKLFARYQHKDEPENDSECAETEESAVTQSE